VATVSARQPAPSTRRRFLLATGTAAAAVAMPQVARAQTITWKYQSTWPSRDIFHEMAVGYAKRVHDLTGGRFRLDVLAAGTVVPAFQTQDAVHTGILDASHGVTAYWYGTVFRLGRARTTRLVLPWRRRSALQRARQ
jgi:TRAP-type mannitol/chloroaromatic compound transport system substrate-binding protein